MKYRNTRDMANSGTRYGTGNAMFQYIGKKLAGTQRNWATIDAVRQIADQIGATPSQVAVSWSPTDRPLQRTGPSRAVNVRIAPRTVDPVGTGRRQLEFGERIRCLPDSPSLARPRPETAVGSAPVEGSQCEATTG